MLLLVYVCLQWQKLNKIIKTQIFFISDIQSKWGHLLDKWLGLRDFAKHACIPTFFTIFFHEKIQINTD